MLLGKIEVFSHFFMVSQVQPRLLQVIRSFTRPLIKFDYEKDRFTGQFQKVGERVFMLRTADGYEYRYHRHQFEEFIAHLKANCITEKQAPITYHGEYIPKAMPLKMPASWAPYDYQEPLIDYIVAPGHTKVVTLQTGGGKTATALKAAELLGVRLGIVVLGRFVDKWVSDVKDNYSPGKNRIMVIRGYQQLKTVLHNAAIEPVDCDVIIITSTTLQQYIEHFKGSRFQDQEPWLVRPELLWQTLGIGFRILDEAHMGFHNNFLIDLATHIPKSLYLSATLEPDDPFIEEMYKIAYPMSIRMDGGVLKKYAYVTAISYKLQFWQKARYTGFGGSYNHTEYEKWLMKKDKPLKNYLDLIYTVVQKEYLKKREPGQKMLIFAATIELCKIIRDDLRKRSDIRGISVEKYTGEDDYEVIVSNDIVVTTLGSAGTALDIPGLLCCLMTTSISSRQANIQALGRIRELKKWPNSKAHFLYFFCENISKQVEYHNKKKEIFNGRVLEHREIEAGIVI